MTMLSYVQKVAPNSVFGHDRIDNRMLGVEFMAVVCTFRQPSCLIAISVTRESNVGTTLLFRLPIVGSSHVM
jgi:hypothetical protein